jgi:hypothetical protein
MIHEGVLGARLASTQVKEHTYRSKIEWTGAAAGAPFEYAKYSREFRLRHVASLVSEDRN